VADNPYAKYANPYAGYVPVGVPDPSKPLELQSKQLGIQRTKQEIDLANATAEANAEKAKADALKAQIDAKTEQEQYAAQHPSVSETGLFGNDYLKTLSQSDRSMVKALSEGRLAFPQGAALRSPFWQEKLSQVAQYDPTFDATDFNARAKGRANAISGRLGQSNNALNTAIGHLGQLSDQISGTASHDFTPFNAIENTVSKTFGSPGVTNFQDTAAKLADELEAVYRNGGGAEQGVTRQLRSLDPNMSLAQKQGVINNAMDLLASKMAANLSQYNFGTGGKPTFDMLDPHTLQVLHDKAPGLLNKYFAPPSGGAGTPPGAPPIGPTGGPDLSGMVGGPSASLATGQYRNQFDPVMANTFAAFIRKGVPYDTAAAFAQSHGATPPDPQTYAAAVAFAKQHGGAVNVEANKAVPTTMGERLAASPAAALLAGGARGATAGLSDVAMRSLAGPQSDANLQALSLTNPGADLTGNALGGIAGMMGGEAALGKIAPNLVNAARASRIAPYLPAASDAAYGATYGASENPADPLQGALTGGLTGAASGMFARGATKAIGRAIAPSAGAMAPLYDQGVLPTIGQRAAAMSGPISGRIGKALNVTEQALQSVPILGALPAMAREGARKEFQVGAFNDALNELGQQLPKGVNGGPEAHQFADKVFNNAYNQARSGMQFVADQPFGQDYGQFTQSLRDGTLSSDQASHVEQAIKTSLNGRLVNGGMDGPNYKAAISDLQRKAATWAGNPNTSAQAAYLTQFSNILDDAARRNSDPQATALLDAADKGYAKFVRVQQASKLGGAQKDAGTFTPNNYASAVKSMGGGLRSNVYSRGNALGQDYAQAGLNLSDTLPDSGTAGRVATMGLLGGAEGAAMMTGHLGISPAALGMFAPYVGKLGNKLVAPRQYTLPLSLADPLNLVGNGLYDRSGAIGRVGAPAALGYFGGP
jgi:hypothetical protein